jgi:predicted MFS family arabinose efflux permease
MGIVIGGIAISQVSIIPFSSYMASVYGWQISFIIQGFVSSIAILGIIWFIPDLPVTEKKSYGSQLLILKKPSFLISIAVNVFMIAAWFSTYSYFADYLGKAKLMSPQQISYMLLLFGITGVIANWLSGRLLAKNVPLTTAFFLTGSILLPVVLLYSGSNFYVQTGVVAFWGIMYGPCFLTATAYMIQAAPESTEFANSLQTSFGNLGLSIGTAVGGWVIATKGITVLPWVGAIFGILAVLLIVWRSALDRTALTNKKAGSVGTLHLVTEADHV